MVQKKIRFGVAGPGSIGHSHSSAIQQVENAELVSVFGRDEVKTSEFAAKYNITPPHQY